MRHGSGVQPRECIVPEVSRTHHFGEHGTNVQEGNGIAKLLARMKAAELPIGELGDLTYLLQPNYEAHLRETLVKAELLRGGLDEFVSKMKAKSYEAGHVYLVPYVREEYKAFAKLLTITPSQPRTAHRGLILTQFPLPGISGLATATFALADRRQNGTLPDELILRPHAARKVQAARAGESCDSFCKRVGMRCDAKELEFINTCEHMKKAFPCEDGCGHQVGPELPAYVHSKDRDTALQCLVTDDEISQCKASCPATTRLCVCVPE